jgi:hypothetical protein
VLFTAVDRANYDLNFSRSVVFDDAIDLIDRVDGSTEKICGMRGPRAETAFEISWITSVVDLDVLVAGNILQLDSIWGVIRPNERTVGPGWNGRAGGPPARACT